MVQLERVDLKEEGYSSLQEFEEVVKNTNNYLNRADKNKRTTIINQRKAGEVETKKINGQDISVKRDKLGFPIFKDYAKTDINILEESGKINGEDNIKLTKDNIADMQESEHMKTATRKLCAMEKEKAENSGIKSDEQLKKDGFNDKQIKNGSKSIDGYLA